MSFRNNKTKEELIESIKNKVFGQDKAVEDLVYFADQVCDRAEALKTNNLDPLDLPQIGSMFIIAPSGTGKTYLANTYAHESGMLFHKIDSTQMTAEGWSGDSFSNQRFKPAKSRIGISIKSRNKCPL